ncbi:hypothetical protein Ccr5_gp260 [Caulobacter phage Ccr5]|nr:hypothetical protein Ccr5_gp260 [Caulobacter phage Ccr5]
MIRSRNEPPEVTARKMAERWSAQKNLISGFLAGPAEALNANWQYVSALLWAHCDLRVVGDWQDRPVRGWTAESINAPFDICMIEDRASATIQNGDLAVTMLTTLLPHAEITITKASGRNWDWEVLVDTRFAAHAKFEGMVWGFGPSIALAAWRAYFSYVNKEPTDV